MVCAGDMSNLGNLWPWTEGGALPTLLPEPSETGAPSFRRARVTGPHTGPPQASAWGLVEEDEDEESDDNDDDEDEVDMPDDVPITALPSHSVRPHTPNRNQ